MLYCFVGFQTLPSPFRHYCPISNTFGVQTPPSHFGHQHATLDTNVQSWTFSSKSTNVWIKEWSPCYVCREYFLIARFYRMLHHLSTFIQAVCTRSLTSFALFTATLKHSCSLSSTRGEPPWRKKKKKNSIMKNSPPTTITSMNETASEYRFSLQNGCCCCCCNWTVSKGKSFFFPAPRLSDHQSTCYLVYELLQFYHHLWRLLSQFQSLDFPLHLLGQQTILYYKGKKKSMFAGFHN